MNTRTGPVVFTPMEPTDTYTVSVSWESRASRIYRRYLKAKGGIPYALRFKAWCKKWGIEL